MSSIASLIVRIGAQDQEIQNALASIGQKAKSVDADLKKLGGSPLAGQAQKSLENLRATMTQVTAAQERVADRARLAAQGLEAMGGASRLTDSQLKQVNRTLQEGLSAYSALGKEPPAALKRIAAETKNAMATTDGWKASLKSLGTAIGAVFTVGMFVNFGRDLLRMGDDIVRVADRTGLLTDEVQQLSYISAQSGNSIDELVGAIGQMQNRLSSGDKSAVGAVKALNLSFEELRKAGPYQQLELIAEAVGKIENPALRAQYAMDLFGRSGIAILPTLTAKFKELGDAAPKMSEDTVRALDRAGDALHTFQLQVKVWAAESYNSARLFFDAMLAFGFRFRAQFIDAIASTLETASTLVNRLKALVPSGTVVGAGLNLLPDLSGSVTELRQSAQLWRDTADGMTEATDNTAKAVGLVIPAFADLSQKTDEAAKAQQRWNELVAAASGHTKGFSYQLDLLHFQLGQMAEIESLLRPNLAVPHLAITPTIFGTGQNVMGGMGRSPIDLPQQTFDALIDRFAALKTALSDFKAEWLDLGNVVNNIAKGFLQNIGSMLSGGVLTLVGKGIELLWGGLKNLFNIASEEETEVSPLREEFFKMQGGLESLNPRVLALTGNLKAVQDVFDARTVDEYNAAIGRLNAILDAGKAKFEALQTSVGNVTVKLSGLTMITPEIQAALENVWDETTTEGYLSAIQELNGELDKQAVKYKTIEDTLKKYGIGFDQAGKAFQQAKLNEKAIELRRDFDALGDSGVDINVQMRGMGSNIRDFIKDAKTAGLEVPESMRQIIQTAIDAGEVFDADGKKVTDITKLGLTFGTTMETAMQTVGEAVDRLTVVLEALAKFLGIELPAAAETGAQKTQDALDGIEAPDLNVGVKWDGKISGLPDIFRGPFRLPQLPDSARSGASTGALVKAWGLQHLQMGGFARGTDTVPAMLTPGELVLTQAQQRNVDAALSSPSVVVNLTMHIDGVFSEGDLVQTIQRRVEPILRQTWEDNVAGSRTNLQDVLGVP